MVTQTTAWPDGTPNWVDLGVDDVAAAQEFYAALFGWEYVSGGEEAGGYLLTQKDGKTVVGIGPKQDPNMPTVWTTYFASSDVDALVNRATEAGGTLLMAPMDVMDSGRMAVVQDTVGAVFGVWQADNHVGAEMVNEPGALCWNELHTRDYQRARDFYASVFGFSYTDIGGDDFTYSTFERPSDRRGVGGIHHDVQLPEDAPNYWMAWFATGNVDDTLARAHGLGATTLMPAMDSPFGRMSVVQGPQGEVFGIIEVPETGAQD